jgi:NAD(P)-dependent dehydrogenase (short-subunit alcohol dehydrogenase family)
MPQDQTKMQDPKQEFPQPPLQEEHPQQMPGTESDMAVKPDHGEESYRGLGRLPGRVALITGADSGIGKAVAIAFAREGADVAISYLSEHQDAEDTAKWVRQAGRKAILLPGDVGDETLCQRIVQRTVSELGKLDILVNNAAYQMSHPQSLLEISKDELEMTFKTNIFAMFFLSKAALQVMPPGGAIINTTSIQAYQPSPTLIHYATTKGAIVTFTKALAEFSLEKGVRVNAVAPGPVWTPLIPSSMPKEHFSKFGENGPMKRTAQPAELAPAYVFLASQESSYVDGEILGVTGGKPLA